MDDVPNLARKRTCCQDSRSVSSPNAYCSMDRNFILEPLESRQLLANVVWDGGPTALGTDLNLAANWVGDVLPAATDTAVIDTAGPTITCGASITISNIITSRAIRVNAGTLTTTGVNSLASDVILAGGTMAGGTWEFSGGSRISVVGRGELASVRITGDVVVDAPSVFVRVSGTTIFSALRLVAGGSGVDMNAGYVLRSLVVAEGPATGSRSIATASNAAGNNRFSSTAIVRLAPGCGASLLFQSIFSGTLTNDGLITAEAADRVLSAGAPGFINNGTLAVSAGTLRLGGSSFRNDGIIRGTGGEVEVAGGYVVNFGTLDTAAATLRFTGTITHTGFTTTFNAASGSPILSGCTITGGVLNFVDSTTLNFAAGVATLNNVTVNTDLFLNTQLSNITLMGSTTFPALHMSAPRTVVLLGDGYTLNSTIVADGPEIGDRFINAGVGGARSTMTLGPSGVIRLAQGCGGNLILSIGQNNIFVNRGLLSAEATGRILSINNIVVQNNVFENVGTLFVQAGTLRIINTTWISPGTLSGTGGTLEIGGVLNATNGFGPWNTADALVVISGSILNSSHLISFNAASGSPFLAGGTIDGGSLSFADGTSLKGTSGGGTLANVILNGDITLGTDGARVMVSGSTNFTAARLTAANVTLEMPYAYTLNSLVVAEGGAPGIRNINLSSLGAGIVTFGPSAVVRLAAGAGGGLNINNVFVATLINNGLISAEAVGQSLGINNSSLANGGTIRALAGFLNITNSFTNTGVLSGTTGDLNITGTFNNSGYTQTIGPSEGTWRLRFGSIVGGNINVFGGYLAGTSSGGTLNNVVVNGAVTLGTENANILLRGTTTFTVAVLSASGATLGMAPGYVLQDRILVQGPATGLRNISHSVGGSGTVTYAIGAVVRVDVNSGGGLNMSNSLSSTVINNGLVSSEAPDQTLNVNISNFLNYGTIRTLNGGRVVNNIANWLNPGTLDIQTGEMLLGGSGTFTNSGIINVGPGGIVTVANSGGFNTTFTGVVNAAIAGTLTSQYGRIVVSSFDATLSGTLNIAFAGAYQPPVVSTFNIVTVNQPASSIIGGFSTTVMPPPGVDGKNFMFNDSRHITFAFSSLADYNSDTIVDFFDYLDFVNDFSNQTGGADFNLDGVIDFFDYLDFLVIFSRF